MTRNDPNTPPVGIQTIDVKTTRTVFDDDSRVFIPLYDDNEAAGSRDAKIPLSGVRTGSLTPFEATKSGSTFELPIEPSDHRLVRLTVSDGPTLRVDYDFTCTGTTVTLINEWQTKIDDGVILFGTVS